LRRQGQRDPVVVDDTNNFLDDDAARVAERERAEPDGRKLLQPAADRTSAGDHAS
jgi:hypothetical protein